MNFDDISKKLIKISKDTVTEVQKMSEVRQLGAKVNDEKKKINKIYMEIGKKLYDMYREDPLAGFETELGGIDEGFARIDLLQAQIRSVKGVVLCPCCKMEVGIHESFCSNCGSKMPETVPIEDVEAAVVLDAGDVTETDAEDSSDAEVTAEACAETEAVDEADAEMAAEACEAETEAVSEEAADACCAEAEVVDESDVAKADGVIAEEAVSEDAEAAAQLDGASPEAAAAEDVTLEQEM